jgi:hypothetical protein
VVPFWVKGPRALSSRSSQLHVLRRGHDAATNATSPAMIGHQTHWLWRSKLLIQSTITQMVTTTPVLGHRWTLMLRSAKAIVGQT